MYFIGLGGRSVVHYTVNFSPELIEITNETKYMEQLGFSVPELSRNVALQEDKYVQYISGLTRMINRYHRLLNSLQPAEVSFMVLISSKGKLGFY